MSLESPRGRIVHGSSPRTGKVGGEEAKGGRANVSSRVLSQSGFVVKAATPW